MKKKTIIFLCVILVLLLFFPIPLMLKDGGSVEYRALTYAVTRIHRLNPDEEEAAAGQRFETGWCIELFGRKVYEKVI